MSRKFLHIYSIRDLQSESKFQVEAETVSEADADAKAESTEGTTFTIPWSMPSTKRRREFSAPDDTTLQQRPMRSEARSRLLKSIAKGWILLDQLVHDRNADLATLAKQQGLTEKSIRATLSLAFLAPDIVEAAIEGRLHRGLTVTKMTSLLSDWKLQRQAIGLT